MTRTAVIAIAFAVLAMATVAYAVRSRHMSNPGFILAAYGVVAVVLTVYIASLSRRLRDARAGRPEPHVDEARTAAAPPPGL
jgi:hypothetical protein